MEWVVLYFALILSLIAIVVCFVKQPQKRIGCGCLVLLLIVGLSPLVYLGIPFVGNTINQIKWTTRGSENYNISVTSKFGSDGFVSFDGILLIRRGKIVDCRPNKPSMKNYCENKTTEDLTALNGYSIEGLFGFIRNCRFDLLTMYPCYAEYDPYFGYPTHVQVNATEIRTNYVLSNPQFWLIDPFQSGIISTTGRSTCPKERCL